MANLGVFAKQVIGWPIHKLELSKLKSVSLKDRKRWILDCIV